MNNNRFSLRPLAEDNRKRFDDEMIELLLRVKWWNRDGDAIASILPLLCNNDLSY